MSSKDKKKETEFQQKLRLRIKSYDHRLIDNSTKQIIETAERNDAKIIGPIPLPTEIKKYTVNRSTFVHKNSREQFEIKVHKRLIDILNPSQKVIDSLSHLNLPAGVEIEIKMI
jgi:small subunit ribosomal protein S10